MSGGKAGNHRSLPPLFLISDAARVGEERFLSVLASAARGGLRMLQVREPGWDEERVREIVLRARDILASIAAAPLLILNRRPALAASLGIDGIHIGGGDPSAVSEARGIAGPGMLIGYSAHSVEELAEAGRRGAGYATFSPVFGAISKVHPLPAVGLEGLERACRASRLPVYALGGVTPEHAAELRRAGAAGAAMVGGILDAPDAEAAVRSFLDGWEASDLPGQA